MDNLKEVMDLKASNLAEKINKIAAAFDIADEITSDDTINYIEEKTSIILSPENSLQVPTQDIMVLSQMKDDFMFGRETLKNNVENGRRVLDSITLDLLDADEDAKASLIMAFAELNKGIADNLKVYFNSWKVLSEIIVNLSKHNIDEPKSSGKVVNNTVNIISTVDLIAAMNK